MTRTKRTGLRKVILSIMEEYNDPISVEEIQTLLLHSSFGNVERKQIANSITYLLGVNEVENLTPEKRPAKYALKVIPTKKSPKLKRKKAP